jgi:hypothetical protein
LFWCLFLQPKLADILPTYPAPFLKYRLQLVQVLRFQKILLGSFKSSRDAIAGMGTSGADR